MNPPETRTVTRFAPSPTGVLHIGTAYSAMYAYDAAKSAGGRFLVRIEDIDQGRCRPEFEDAILEDLAWLGLTWEEPVRRQSGHFADYRAALDRLAAAGLLYPCFCTRADIAAEIEASLQEPGRRTAAFHGPDGFIYPGICRALSADEAAGRVAAGEAHALRLNTGAAAAAAGPLTWEDARAGGQAATPEIFGDVVLARKDTPTSYHLSVSLDDHLQGVTRATRGRDVFASTHVHRLLQALLGLDTPLYDHHAVLTAEDGRKLSKRDKSETIRGLRDDGHSAEAIWNMAMAHAAAEETA